MATDFMRGRTWAIAGLHLLLWSLALVLAHLLIGMPWPLLGQAAAAQLLLFLAVKVGFALALGSFHELWGHTSLEDLASLLEASVLASAVLAGLCALAPALGGTPWLATVDGAVTVALLAPVRAMPRLFAEVVRPALDPRGWLRRRPVVLAGRAELLELELRRIQRRPSTADRVVGLVVDGPVMMEDALLRRVRVLGWRRLERLLHRRRIAEVILVPPVSGAFTAELERLCGASRVACRSVASLLALAELEHDPRPLLPRPPTELDEALRRQTLAGRRVLVTGAGGSIGSELARQVAALAPERLILVDRSENALFRIEHELAGTIDCSFEARVLDVRDAATVQRLFAATRPEVVFHAAAHKHVPIMERHPAEAVLNNVFGTRIVSEAADGFGTESFVFISTDKAVRPASVMGATKRLAERWVRKMAGRSRTRFVAVRFGNVLGSSGSVLPIFIAQIQRGGPVTVTHPEMRRFFMSIPQACGLVLEAASLGEGGELFVLDMGKPVRIVDLARRLIERAGLRPGDDVPIVFSGARPGEKLYEELAFSDETVTSTVRAGILRVAGEEEGWEIPPGAFERLERCALDGDDRAVRALLGEILPEYQAADLDRLEGAAEVDAGDEAVGQGAALTAALS